MIYSRQLSLGHQNTSGTQNIYTVPAGITAVVRDIQMMATTPGTPSDCFLYMGGEPVWYSGLVTGYANVHEECRIVLNAGEVIQIDVHAGTWSFLLSGYELN